MKHPLAAVAGLFAAGIALGRYWAPSLPWLFAITLAVGAASLISARWRERLLVGFLVLAGWTNLAWRLAVLAPDDLRHRETLAAHGAEALVTLRGRITSPPEQRIRQRGARWITNTLVVISATALQPSEGTWEGASGRILVSTPGILPSDLRRGSEVLVSGVLRHPAGPSAPGLFDYRAHLGWRGIHFELRAGLDDWQTAPGSPLSAQDWAERFQDWARRSLARGLPEADEELRLLYAMTLGWRTGLTDEVEEPFMRSGTMHLFAISGLHIALLAGMVGHLLRLCLVPRLAVGLVVLPVVWLYTAATYWQPSAVRATVMTTVIVGSWMLARPARLLNSLAFAGFGLLLWDPRQLFHAGFQLSFAVVAAIGLLSGPADAWLRQAGEPDPFLPAHLVPRWRRWLENGWRWLAASLAVSAASWIGSTPLTAHYFHLVTPVSLVANVVVVPLSSAALASNLGSLVCSPLLPGVAEAFNHGAWFWMRAMLTVSRWAADLPWGCRHVPGPPLAFTALWYLILITAGLAWWRHPRLRWLAGTAAAGLALASAWEWSARRSDARLVILPLRGGQAVWWERGGTSDLVDTGDAADASHRVQPFLQAAGVNRLRFLTLTHGDVRHVGGAVDLARRFPPDRVLLAPVRFRSSPYRAVVSELQARFGDRVRTAADGDAVGPWQVLHPREGDRSARADDACLVLVGAPTEPADADAPRTRILLLADLDRSGQERLWDRHPGLQAEVVITGLPGVGEPLNSSLLERLGPRLVVVVDSLDPATARAPARLKERLRRSPARVLFTSELGSLDLRWKDGRWTVLDAAGRVITRSDEPLPRESVADESGIVAGDEI